MSVQTTARQVKLFERSVRRWQRELGLRDWEIFVECRSSESGNANCTWNTEQHVANISINNTQPVKFSDAYIERFALHECLELLMSGCTDIMDAAVAENVYSVEVHRVIRAIENVILGDPK